MYVLICVCSQAWLLRLLDWHNVQTLSLTIAQFHVRAGWFAIGSERFMIKVVSRNSVALIPKTETCNYYLFVLNFRLSGLASVLSTVVSYSLTRKKMQTVMARSTFLGKTCCNQIIRSSRLSRTYCVSVKCVPKPYKLFYANMKGT